MRHLLCITLISLCLISCKENNYRTSFWNTPYDSLEEAEERLVAHYESTGYGDDYRYRYNEELVDLVINDTSTLSYPFQLLQDHGHASVVTSNDARLRCYSWNNLSGGTCVSYSNIVQYRFADKVYAHNTSILDLTSGETSGKNIFGSDIRRIYTLQTDGLPIYLIYTYNRESSNWGYSDVSAVKIIDDKIVPVNLFLDEEGKHASIGVGHTIADWYFTANDGEGWDWLFRFDTNTQTLYVPIIESVITDQYTLYQFTGKYMEKKRQSGGYWLHPSIRNFKRLFYLFETEEYRVRVDEMNDGTYRYASWLAGQDMSEKPKIIIHDGFLHEDDGRSCFFKNEDYTYIVDGDELVVFNPNNRIILQQSKVTSDTYE